MHHTHLLFFFFFFALLLWLGSYSKARGERGGHGVYGWETRPVDVFNAGQVTDDTSLHPTRLGGLPSFSSSSFFYSSLHLSFFPLSFILIMPMIDHACIGRGGQQYCLSACPRRRYLMVHDGLIKERKGPSCMCKDMRSRDKSTASLEGREKLAPDQKRRQKAESRKY